MHSDRYEKAFEDFLLSDTYEEKEKDPFDLTRAAFQAGWEAARARSLVGFTGNEAEETPGKLAANS